MDFEQELKKFELSSVFTINFSWLKQYVESRNGMYTPIRNISDDDFREIESSFYALQVAWKAWREAKDQAVPEGFVLVPKEPTYKMMEAADNCAINGKITANIIYKAMIEAVEPTND